MCIYNIYIIYIYIYPSTWYQVLCTRYLGARYLVSGMWYQVFGTRYLVPGAWYQVLVLGTKYLIRHWYQVLGTRS